MSRIYGVILGSLAWAVTAGGGTSASAPGRLVFREPGVVTYIVDPPSGSAALSAAVGSPWLRAEPEGQPAAAILVGPRVVLGVDSAERMAAVLVETSLPVSRWVTSQLAVLEAPDAWTAAVEASRLAELPGVEVSHPVRRRNARLHGHYAPQPNDPLFAQQWHLENRDTNTALVIGPDLNARTAWASTQGQGVLVATADNGVELSHPDLALNVTNRVHFNFITSAADGNPVASSQTHATAVGGLIAARANNAKGVSGVAPQAQLASWVIFDRFDSLASEEAVMDMFQYRSNVVSVQNHSWGNADVRQLSLSTLEDQGLANAVTLGRQGRGVVIVRSAGNGRLDLMDVNDDGYGQDPRAIAVGAVRSSGRATSYSSPGAPVLVAAFSGDDGVQRPDGSTTNFPRVATTDRQGSLGYNSSGPSPDYGFQATGFTGTSASSPEIAGVCALILSANPELTYRDVQQVLILSARQLDSADPDLRSNGAGLAASHNVGFGVPDAGLAVELARAWSNRPPAATATATYRQPVDIPDDGLRVVIQGDGVPTALQSIPAWPSDGLHPDAPTAVLTLVDAGLAQKPITADLNKRAALIKRGGNYFADKIANAAAAGARFAVIYNDQGATERVYMNGADIQFQPIPAVFIDQNSGQALQTYLAANPQSTAQLRLNSVKCPLTITSTLLCEHVKVRARFSHPRRADVRLTLVSPAGTRSVLHRYNDDTTSPLSDWTFYSSLHFYEATAGVWTAEVSDERAGSTGRLLSLELTVTGVPITDTDGDGLDDVWELTYFGSLVQGAKADPDGDGWSTMREQILGTDPAEADRPLFLDLSRWDARWGRLAWPASPDFTYEVLGWSDLGREPQLLARLPGRFPELDYVVPWTTAGRYYQVRRVSGRAGQ